MLIILITLMSLTSPGARAENPAVEKIRGKYEAIKKSEKKLVRAELDSAAGESSEGSKAEVFRERGAVKQIREEYFGESGRVKYSMFYENGKAFFVLEENTRYSIPFMEKMEGMPPPTQEMVESRYYIDGSRVIKYLEGKKEMKPGSEDFKKRESEILDLAADALENAN